MKISNVPTKMGVVFGVNGQRQDLLADTESGEPNASYNAGFPPITMIAKSAGGQAPLGKDFNQIFYELAADAQWSQASGVYPYDSAFSTAIGGYPKGALVLGNDNQTLYQNTVDDNTVAPGADSSWNVIPNDINKTYNYIGEYTDGIVTISNKNQFITYKGIAYFYNPNVTLPLVTTGTDESSWIYDSSNFISSSSRGLVDQLSSSRLLPNGSSSAASEVITSDGGSFEQSLNYSGISANSSKYNGVKSSIDSLTPYVVDSKKMSYESFPIREMVIPSPGRSDYLNSPKLVFKTARNKKLEVWAVHPYSGRNSSNYQDIYGIDSSIPKSKEQRFRYKLLDKDDSLESVIFMRYKPATFTNVYGQYISYSSSTLYSSFNFYMYFNSGISTAVNGEINLFNKIAEPLSKRYLNRYIAMSDSNGKYAVFPVYFFATTSTAGQAVMRVFMNAEPDGTLLTGTSKYVSGYYGQSGASAVTYTSFEVIVTSEKLVTGTGLSTPYTVYGGVSVYLNGMGSVMAIKSQATTTERYVPTTVITSATLDTSSSTPVLNTTTGTVNSLNTNLYTGLCTYNTRMAAIKDQLKNSYFASTSIADLLGDFSTGYDYVLYTGTPQLFANHTDIEWNYVNG